jgi:hypothetical protein
MAVSNLLAIEVSDGTAWCNRIIPIVLLVAMVKFTEWYPDHAAGAAPGA